MSYRRCFFLVEGTTDEVFLERVVVPQLSSHYSHIEIRTFSGGRPQDLRRLFHSWSRMGDVFVIADQHPDTCISAAKARLTRQFDNAPVSDVTIIAVPEIEAWYIAGLSIQFAQRYGINVPQVTDNVNKQVCHSIRQGTPFSSGLDFMIEITKYYDIDLAKQRSASFRYLAQRLGI